MSVELTKTKITSRAKIVPTIAGITTEISEKFVEYLWFRSWSVISSAGDGTLNSPWGQITGLAKVSSGTLKGWSWIRPRVNFESSDSSILKPAVQRKD